MVYKLGPDGAFQEKYELGTGENYHSNFGFHDPVAKMNSGGFASTVQHFNGYDFTIDLARFDALGNMLPPVSVMTSDPADSNLVGTRQMRQTSDGGFVYCGFRDTLGASGSAMLVKLDSTGLLEWERTYGAPDQLYEGMGVAQYTDGGFLLLGYRLPGNLTNLGWLIRTDSLGNQIWRRFFGDNGGGSGAVRVAADGGIVSCTEYREVNWPWGWAQYDLIKRNPSGNIIWETRSHYFYQAFPRDFEILQDQTIIACGIYSWYTELAKYAATGDSLWSRHLTVFNNMGDHWPYDVEPTSDGGFLLTGLLFQTLEDPTPNMETIFVIKTDSLGCVVPGCQNVGVQEYVMDLQKLLRLSPNPASDVVRVVLDLPEGGEVEGQVQAQLLDETGRLVLEQSVQQNLNLLRATLVVSALPAGTYYLHLRDTKRWLAGSKLVVE